LHLVASDIQEARGDRVPHGTEIGGAFDAGTPGALFQPDSTSGRVSGPASDDASNSSFATFRNLDGNDWLLQDVTTRLPGRIEAAQAAVASAAELSGVMRRGRPRTASTRSGSARQARDLPDWYAA
jgi:hypothetical protein